MPLATLSPAQRRFWAGFWGGTFVAFGVIDLYRMTKHDGSTLSENIRRVFRTDTPEGEALFLAALAVLARHILDR